MRDGVDKLREQGVGTRLANNVAPGANNIGMEYAGAGLETPSGPLERNGTHVATLCPMPKLSPPQHVANISLPCRVTQVNTLILIGDNYRHVPDTLWGTKELTRNGRAFAPNWGFRHAGRSTDSPPAWADTSTPSCVQLVRLCNLSEGRTPFHMLNNWLDTEAQPLPPQSPAAVKLSSDTGPLYLLSDAPYTIQNEDGHDHQQEEKAPHQDQARHDHAYNIQSGGQWEGTSPSQGQTHGGGAVLKEDAVKAGDEVPNGDSSVSSSVSDAVDGSNDEQLYGSPEVDIVLEGPAEASCTVCQASFSTKAELAAHLVAEPSVSGHVVSMLVKFPISDRHRGQMRCFHQEEDMKFLCVCTDFTFSTTKQALAHLQAKLPKERRQHNKAGRKPRWLH
ncbi:hypothetical protein BV22DRAFT_1051048 [Leucogyrophana mollusca]|uniref:Uncharacterized protein n=1 Tax=Leucogyrophana mollusca TaxID=85980 RepID=A0ACB8B2S3_9AGAM|nr:hypothetical protein BV22DRAFT_1051048 [Leucogyrophana mollusca]